MKEEHKKKIAVGVKKYHACAKENGCGKKKKQATDIDQEIKNLMRQDNKIRKNKVKKVVKKAPVKIKILALEDLKEKTKPKKEKKKFKVNNAERSMANFNFENIYKKTPAKVLGVKARASPEEIKKAFRPFLKFHPDKPTGNLEKFTMYNSAYSSLIKSIDILD